MKKILFILLVLTTAGLMAGAGKNKNQPFFDACKKEANKSKPVLEEDGKKQCIVIQNVYCGKKGSMYKPAMHYSKCNKLDEQTRIRGTILFKRYCPNTLKKMADPCKAMTEKLKSQKK